MYKVLCVEDEGELRRDIADEIREAGYEVIEAENGKIALEKIQRENPDLIVCDITMPVMNGYELVKIIRQEGSLFIDKPVMFLTALSDRTDVVKGLNSGADDYMTKPIDYDILIAKIAAMARRIGLQKPSASDEDEVESKNPEQSVPMNNTAIKKVMAYIKKHEKARFGKINYLNIESLKKIFGEKWEKWVPNIISTTEHVIGSKLGKNDTFIKVDTFGYLILYADLSEDEAAFKTHLIAEEIKEKLIGVDVNFEAVSLYSGAIDVCQMLGNANTFKTEEGKEEDPKVVLEKRFNDLSNMLKCKFSAAWNQHNNMVFGYFSTPVLERETGITLVKNSLNLMPSEMVARFDRIVVSKSIENYGVRPSLELSPIMVVPLHIESIVEHNVGGYLSGVMASYEIPRRTIVAELIFNGGEDVKMLKEAVKIITQSASGVFYRDRKASLSMVDIAACGVKVAGISLGDPAWNGTKGIEAFNNMCKGVNIHRFVTGIDYFELLFSALASSYAIVSGKVIAQLKDHATETYKVSREKLSSI